MTCGEQSCRSNAEAFPGLSPLIASPRLASSASSTHGNLFSLRLSLSCSDLGNYEKLVQLIQHKYQPLFQ